MQHKMVYCIALRQQIGLLGEDMQKTCTYTNVDSSVLTYDNKKFGDVVPREMPRQGFIKYAAPPSLLLDSIPIRTH